MLILNGFRFSVYRRTHGMHPSYLCTQKITRRAVEQTQQIPSPLPARGKQMITTQFIKTKNNLLNEDIVTPRIVNMQVMEFDEWCENLADGSTVTPADVAAVMKRIEKRLPSFLALNAKVICSPDGLTFRPKVSGSISQSDLKKKLQARKAAESDPEKAAKIDVNRTLKTSDLSVKDCTLSIVIDLPKSWSTDFNTKAKLKRVAKNAEELEESGDTGVVENTDNENTGGTTGGTGTDNTNTDNTDPTDNGGPDMG